MTEREEPVDELTLDLDALVPQPDRFIVFRGQSYAVTAVDDLLLRDYLWLIQSRRLQREAAGTPEFFTLYVRRLQLVVPHMPAEAIAGLSVRSAAFVLGHAEAVRLGETSLDLDTTTPAPSAFVKYRGRTYGVVGALDLPIGDHLSIIEIDRGLAAAGDDEAVLALCKAKLAILCPLMPPAIVETLSLRQALRVCGHAWTASRTRARPEEETAARPTMADPGSSFASPGSAAFGAGR